MEQAETETFKDVASTIREYAIMARETSKALRESGAIPELVVAVREIASVVRDIAAEVKETSRELKESGVTNEIASTVEEITDITKYTGSGDRGYGKFLKGKNTKWNTKQYFLGRNTDLGQLV